MHKRQVTDLQYSLYLAYAFIYIGDQVDTHVWAHYFNSAYDLERFSGVD